MAALATDGLRRAEASGTMTLKKDTKKLVARVTAAPGWRVEERQGCWMCYSPDGETIVNIHKTPSSQRTLRNAMALLKRGGFNG